MKKRLLSWILVLCMVLTLVPADILAVGGDTNPESTPAETAEEPAGAVQSGLLSEPDDGAEPYTAGEDLVDGTDGTMTRAEWLHNLAVVFEMSMDEDNLPDNYYSDLTEEHTYYKDILLAVGFGLVDIPAGGEFKPDDPATREFAAHTLNFCLGYQLDDDASYTFSEQNDVTYTNDVQVAINRGWFALSGEQFLPEQAITAAEATAMLSDAAEVLGTAVADPNYDSVYKFADGVIVIPEGTVVTVSDHVVTIQNCPEEIVVGDIFAVYFSGIPRAFCAVNITQNGATTTIATTDVEDSEAFAEIDAQGEVDAQFTQFEALDGTEITYIDEETGTEYQNAEAAERAVRRAAGTKEIKRTLSATTKIKLGDGISASVKVKISNPKIKYNIDTKTKSAFATLEGKTDISYEIKFDSAAAIKDAAGVKDFELLSCKVPGVGGLIVYLDIETSGSLQGTQSGNLMTGIQYAQGDGFRLIKNFEASNFSLTLELSGKLGLGVKFGVTELPALKAYVYAQTGAKGLLKDVTYNDEELPKECVHFAAYLYANYGATASIKLFGISEEFKYEVSPWNENNSPIRVVHHYEDGKEVSSCSRGHDFSYFTTGFSKYWGSGWSGGSSAWGLNAAGEPIEIYKYTTDDDGNATITGFSGNATALTIPTTLDGYPVVAIGNNAFKNLTQIRVVTIPEGIVTIGDSAFYGCTNLTSVSFPNSLTEIGHDAFYNCKSLTNVELPPYLATLRRESFGNCTSLQHVFIPKTITTCTATWDNDGPFSNCSALDDVTFADGITSIPEYLFSNCMGLTSMEIPETVTAIGDSAFNGCTNLTSVTFPNSLTAIGNAAFYGCKSLTSVELPPYLATLRRESFGNCTSLQHVFIPKTITTCTATWDNDGPFSNCSALDDVTFADGITSIPEYLFSNCTGLTSIEIPETVTKIGNDAFYGCKSLKVIVIPDSVTDMGTYTFAKCSALERAVLPQGRINITEGTFSGCASLKDVTMPDTVAYIRSSAFENCASLEQISLSPELLLIGSYAFDGCTNLKEMNLPEKVTTIGGYAFRNCDSLTEMQITKPVNTLGNYCFYDCDALTSVELADSVTAFGTYCFYDCDALTGIVLPNSITSIGASSFCGCDNLKNVTLSKNLTVIPENCFKDCPSLETIVIPKGVTTIKDSAFMNDTGLTSVTIPVTVTSIESNGFSYSDRMTVYGCAGTYAETYAGDMGFQFVDITNPIEGFELVGGAERVVLDRYQYFTPEYTILATDESKDTTDVLTYTFSNNNAKLVGKQIYGQYAGECEVTVTATSGVTYTFTVVVRATKTLAVTALPEKTSYAYGETLDTTGLVVTANYDNGDVGEVTNYTVSGYDPNTYGEQTVTVSYGGKTASFKVTVVDDRVLLSGIAVTTPPAKTVYVKGEAIDYTGIGITAIYTDGSTQEVPASDCTFGGFNRLKVGVQTITVTYQGQTATFDVTVVAETHVHDYTATVTAPTCTEQGYTTYTCACGDSYVGDYVDALGHHFENGKCTVCGADDPAYDATKGRITVSSVRARAGEEVTLDVSIDHNPGIMVMTLGINYDKSKLEYLGYEDGILTGWTVAKNAVWLGDQDSTENGVMLKLKFRVLDDVEDGDIQVTVLYSDGDIANYQEETLHPAIEPGKVTVYSAISGDFNGDGIINSLDLLRLKKYLADGETEIASGDITGDGIVNSLDLLRLKKHLAGEDVVLN